MHSVARVQPRLDFLTGSSTLLLTMPSERKDNRREKARRGEGRGRETPGKMLQRFWG